MGFWRLMRALRALEESRMFHV
ncbi:uncharacterized protein G2W53_043835 [Senna tora]|uniref:Uncharacterized protein n=1 Tax=Senna tora TaxID=362788 RepID=A0A834W5B4_9FABA|nr:uncharacterized protein G2W53_043835 [Senna tora]